MQSNRGVTTVLYRGIPHRASLCPICIEFSPFCGTARGVEVSPCMPATDNLLPVDFPHSVRRVLVRIRPPRGMHQRPGALFHRPRGYPAFRRAADPPVRALHGRCCRPGCPGYKHRDTHSQHPTPFHPSHPTKISIFSVHERGRTHHGGVY